MAAWSRRPIASRPRLAASRRRPRRHRRQLASTLTAPAFCPPMQAVLQPPPAPHLQGRALPARPRALPEEEAGAGGGQGCAVSTTDGGMAALINGCLCSSALVVISRCLYGLCESARQWATWLHLRPPLLPTAAKCCPT